MKTQLVIRCPQGLGDCLYARPAIRAAAARHDVWLICVWPELFEDLPVRFVRPQTELRTQAANLARQPAGRWATPPASARLVHISYGTAELAKGTIYQALTRDLPSPDCPVWDLPPLGRSPFDPAGPMVLVRPALRRAEWDNPARNPRPEYIAEIAADLKARGHSIVVLCDISPGREWIVGDMPPHHVALVNGELSVLQLLASVRDAALLLGGVGWIVPAAVASGTPAFVVLGGNGGENAPEKILDPRMRTAHIGFAWPRNYCRCSNPQHDCSKQIPDLVAQWSRWRSSASARAAA